MVAVTLRTLLIYGFLILTMRIMGKRQLGDLQLGELVVTFLLSELAVNPITNPEIPVLYAVVPVLLLLSMEGIVSFAATRWNVLKRLLNGSPTVLIRKGVLSRQALSDNRMEVEELLSALRQKGFSSPEEISYAILEENGKLSILPKPEFAPVTNGDRGQIPTDKGVAHPLIIDGKILETELSLCGKDPLWLKEQLRKQNASPETIFLMTIDDNDHIFCLRREDV